MSIYIAYHKKYPLLTENRAYIPLQVGKALSDNKLGMIGDNTGDHISDKNKTYSELTGLYWIWKNTTSAYVGLSHYRRFFFYNRPSYGMQLKKIGEHLIGQGKKRFGVYYTADIENKHLILTENDTIELLTEYDAIIPLGRRMKYTVREQYSRRHVQKDLETTQEIISEKYPDFMQAFNEVMQKKEIFPCNMFVMKRDHFESYMTWLFDILFELERRTDISAYDHYQKRLFGFMSERLFDVWLTKTQLKTKSLPVLYFKKLKI